jgi:hypothetical protein
LGEGKGEGEGNNDAKVFALTPFLSQRERK